MITLGQIDEGVLRGKKVVVAPRTGLPENIYFVERGYISGVPFYAQYCLNQGCEIEIPVQGCPKCNNMAKYGSSN